jgi:NADPH:quinone reductase-like Zn-dependent oxidoreductase
MRAIAIERFGGLDELRAIDVPKPEPAPGEVLIHIRAAGVGIWDSMQRSGELGSERPEFPLILGAECAGDVEKVGEDVTTLAEGDAVYTYFYGKQGAYAEYVAVKADAVAKKPASLSYLEAAAVPVDALTAYQSVHDELKLAANEWFFIAGAAGGVGSFAVQFAIALGARVIASARAENFGLLESLGVAKANLIDYTASDVNKAVRDITGGAGADAALDAVGPGHAKESIGAVKDGGRLAELTGTEISDERKIRVFHVESKPSAEQLDLIAGMFADGHLKVLVGRVFPLAQAREAQQTVEKPHGPGKIVLSVE